MTVTIGEVVERARGEISRLTGLTLSSTVRSVRDENGWLVSIEMVEKKSIPEGMDVLAAYEVRLDNEGAVLGFERKGMRKRMENRMEEAEK